MKKPLVALKRSRLPKKFRMAREPTVLPAAHRSTSSHDLARRPWVRCTVSGPCSWMILSLVLGGGSVPIGASHDEDHVLVAVNHIRPESD
jgi:hypothetical protein